jgi:hypothetical protein
MNELTRDLKNYTFDFSKESKILGIYDKTTGKIITMDKVRMASLARFLIRALYSLGVGTRKSKFSHPDKKRAIKEMEIGE